MAQAQQVMSMFSYKGFIEAGYNAGVGYYKANKFEATTSHGLSSGNFFMGVGAGVDILKTEADEFTRWEEDMDLSDNAYMIPLFLDFRYICTAQINMPCAHRIYRGNAVKQSSLARTRRSHNPDKFTFIDGKTNISNCLCNVVAITIELLNMI